jgi:hypothetical protein
MIINGGTYASGVYRSELGIPKDQLVMYLDSGNPASYNHTNPTTWHDLSGQGNNATINPGMAYFPDNRGIFVLNGNFDSYAQIAPGFGYDYSAGLTINVWAQFQTTENNILWERLVDFGNGPGGVDGYNLIMCNNGDGAGTLLISIDAVNDNYFPPNSGLIPGEAPITFDGWAMYTLFCDGTYWKQYKNGEFYSYEGNPNLPATVTRNLNFIGKSNWGSDPNFTGQMSVITMYNRALTEPEILQTYNAFKGRYGL